MARFRNTLDHVRIAAPCKADWDQMIGNERVRFCSQCSLNVYNLSGMARADAESLIARTEGRLCVRFYRRSDGSIITKDCPIGLRAVRRRVSYIAKAISSAVMGLLAGLGVYVGAARVYPVAHPVVMGAMVARPRVEPPLHVMGEMPAPGIRIGKMRVQSTRSRPTSGQGGVSNR